MGEDFSDLLFRASFDSGLAIFHINFNKRILLPLFFSTNVIVFSSILSWIN